MVILPVQCQLSGAGWLPQGNPLLAWLSPGELTLDLSTALGTHQRFWDSLQGTFGFGTSLLTLRKVIGMFEPGGGSEVVFAAPSLFISVHFCTYIVNKYRHKKSKREYQ